MPLSSWSSLCSLRLRQAQHATGDGVLEDLVGAAESLRSYRCSAHLLIGLTHLADRDRAGARRHFSAAVKTQDYFNNDYTLSRVLLARMEDPAWPPWPANQ